MIILLVPVAFVEMSSSKVLFLLLVIAVGVVQTMVSMRIGFDSALLKNLCKNNQYELDSLQSLDHALLKLSLIKSTKVDRGINDRLSGCKDLFKWQVILCLIQIVVLLASALVNI